MNRLPAFAALAFALSTLCACDPSRILPHPGYYGKSSQSLNANEVQNHQGYDATQAQAHQGYDSTQAKPHAAKPAPSLGTACDLENC